MVCLCCDAGPGPSHTCRNSFTNNLLCAYRLHQYVSHHSPTRHDVSMFDNTCCWERTASGALEIGISTGG